MKFLFVTCTIFSLLFNASAQKPCTAPAYRQFDFWIGEWEVYATNGTKAGDSKISLLLDSCIIFEEWTSTAVTQGLHFAGKSFNTWNRTTRQWQQTWVDNTGGTTEYLEGKYDDQKIIFLSNSFSFAKDTMAIRKLTFFNLSKDKVRQLGEINKNNSGMWQTEFDLEYRRRE